MPTNNELHLIDHLDNNLDVTESARVNAEIRGDQELAADWEYLKLAVDTVSLAAIREKVAKVRESAKAEAPVAKMENKEGAVVRGMFQTTMRIAVAAVLILGASAVYKYITVSNASVYGNAFSDYELGTSRGNEAGDRMEAAYRDRNWSAVLEAFSQQTVKTNKSYFLAGMASMELKQYPAAVTAFEQVLSANAKSKENYFQPETEYYLGLAYLMNHQDGKGLDMIRKIRSDVFHPYYPLAVKISAADLKIVELKN